MTLSRRGYRTRLYGEPGYLHVLRSVLLADGETLLAQMRQRDVRVPVVVFASGDHAEENREAALRLGALEYTFTWDALYAVIDRFA